MGFHLMGALSIAGIALVYLVKNKKKGFMLCSVAIITMAVMFLDFFLFRGGTAGIGQEFSIAPFHSFHRSLASLGTDKLPWLYFPIVFIGYTLATFGARAFGFLLLKNAFKKNNFNLVVVFLAVFAISGFLLSEVISIGAPDSILNNAIWFSTQSLFGAWLLVAYFLMEKKQDQKRFLALVSIIVLLSLPSTIQFLSLRYNSNYYHVNTNAMEVIKLLKNVPPESTVLHSINKEPSLASDFAGRASVINTYKPFALSAIGEKDCLDRISDVKSFFSMDNLVGRSFILEKYHVDYVYAPRAFCPILDKEPMLYNVLRNDDYVVYKTKKTNF